MAFDAVNLKRGYGCPHNVQAAGAVSLHILVVTMTPKTLGNVPLPDAHDLRWLAAAPDNVNAEHMDLIEIDLVQINPIVGTGEPSNPSKLQHFWFPVPAYTPGVRSRAALSDVGFQKDYANGGAALWHTVVD